MRMTYERNGQENSNEKLFLEYKYSIVMQKEDAVFLVTVDCAYHIIGYLLPCCVTGVTSRYIWGEYSWGPAIAIGVWRPAHPFDGPRPRVSICINVTSQCSDAQRQRPSASTYVIGVIGMYPLLAECPGLYSS